MFDEIILEFSASGVWVLNCANCSSMRARETSFLLCLRVRDFSDAGQSLGRNRAMLKHTVLRNPQSTSPCPPARRRRFGNNCYVGIEICATASLVFSQGTLLYSLHNRQSCTHPESDRPAVESASAELKLAWNCLMRMLISNQCLDAHLPTFAEN